MKGHEENGRRRSPAVRGARYPARYPARYRISCGGSANFSAVVRVSPSRRRRMHARDVERLAHLWATEDPDP